MPWESSKFCVALIFMLDKLTKIKDNIGSIGATAVFNHRANPIKEGTVLHSNRARPNVSADFCLGAKLDPLMGNNIAPHCSANDSHSHFNIRVNRGGCIND